MEVSSCGTLARWTMSSFKKTVFTLLYEFDVCVPGCKFLLASHTTVSKLYVAAKKVLLHCLIHFNRAFSHLNLSAWSMLSSVTYHVTVISNALYDCGLGNYKFIYQVPQEKYLHFIRRSQNQYFGNNDRVILKQTLLVRIFFLSIIGGLDW